MRSALRDGVLLVTLALFVVAGLVAACGHSASSSVDSGPDCGPLDAGNPDACPATYDTADLPATCAPLGLVCLYPGQGDGTFNGCPETAALSCLRNEDAEAGQWVANQ